MYIKTVTLKNFRNYQNCVVELIPGRNILIGENAQGKSNFLEAVEILATGKSSRAEHDSELIGWGKQNLLTEAVFHSRSGEESLTYCATNQTEAIASRRSRIEKTFKVNGLSQSSVRGILGRLLIVSFQSHDLNLLRGGPRFRRDWIDDLILKLRPAFHEVFSNYQKSLAQRNKLLKLLFEKGKLTVSDQDQLLAWDKQLSKFGARIIKERLELLSQLLPVAEAHQKELSRSQESLSIRYLFKVQEKGLSDEEEDGGEESSGPLTAAQLSQMDEQDLVATLMKLIKERRYEELRRRQSLIGPHRDDLVFCLNGVDAVSFASQGQQRSIVLCLKLAELARVSSSHDEAPVLLLDDVLAELDEYRQGLLMSAVTASMQTIITTTHVSGFDAKWLEGAQLLHVESGQIAPSSAQAAQPLSRLD